MRSSRNTHRFYRHSKHCWRARSAIFVACGLVLAVFFSYTPAAFADTEFTVSSEVGFNGFYGTQNWIPVNLTIHNPGATTSGELQLDVDMPTSNGRSATGRMTWPVQLPGGQTVKPQIAVPGQVIANNGSTLRLFVHGEEVYSVHLTGTALGNVSLVATLSEHTQSGQFGQFLTGSTNGSNGPPVLPVALDPSMMPDSSNLLTELTALVAKPETLDKLKPIQIQALQTWVKLGGLLIVAGTEPSPLSTWDKLYPLESGPSQNVSGRDLATFVGESVTPPKDNINTFAKGIRPDAQMWAGSPNKPLIAALHYGRGSVVQTSFAPGDGNLLTWPSNNALWTTILTQGGAKALSAISGLLSDNQALSLASASDALSPLRIPSLQFWMFVFVVYGLIIGPFMFVVLRKMKAEPIAWIALPALSILTTAVIYVFGLSQRPAGTLTEGVGVLDLVGDGDAETYGIRAFMSPAITSAISSASQPMLMLPLTVDNGRTSGTSQVNVGTHTVTFDDVGRWGVRYVYAAGAVSNQGELDPELWSYSEGALLGSVQNSTHYTLHHVALCWDGHLYMLGDLKPGDLASITQNTPSVDVNGSVYLSEYGSFNHDIMRGIGRPLGTVAANLLDVALDKEQAMLVATTNDLPPSLPGIVTGERVASDQTLVLVRQVVNVTVLPQPTGVTAK